MFHGSAHGHRAGARHAAAAAGHPGRRRRGAARGLESSLLPSTGGITHLHRIDLGDGGLIAVGPGTLDDATFVIVGGTGRYLGASGTYHAVQRPREHGGDGTATFTFDIQTPEA